MRPDIDSVRRWSSQVQSSFQRGIHTTPLLPRSLQTLALSLSDENWDLLDDHHHHSRLIRIDAVPAAPRQPTLEHRSTADQSFTSHPEHRTTSPPTASANMDFGFCSPHRETGGTMHLPSPTHHGYRMEGSHFPSITQLRQSLSRSPSRPSRFLRAGKTDSQGSPISPLALSRAFNKPASPVASYSESPFGQQAPQATKKKFALRRSAPFRSSPRNRASTSKSPRRALVDSTDLGNSTPFVGRPIFGEENTHARKNSVDFWEQPDSKRFDIDDKPIKFEFSRSHPPMSSAPGANCFAATQPSPLKRRDGIMGFESVSSDTPNPKRRSLHGSLPSGDDFNIFEQTPAPQPPTEDFQRPRDGEPGNMFSTPIQNTQSPLRKTSALRRTVSQRNSTNSPRPKASRDGVFALPGPAASKTRQRYSLDGSSLSSAETEASFARPMAATQSHLRGGSGGYQRHPLSNAVTASTSSSNPGGETQPFAPVPPTPVPKKHPLSKSLPIGRSQRPQPPLSGQYATPYALKMVQLDSIPVPRSTGVLKSKRNRDIDSPGAERYIPPLTPCKNDSKRHSFPPADSPSTNKRGLQQPQFTPIAHTSKAPTESAGNRPSIFGSFGSISIRRGSFLSEVGDDENSHSPTGNHMTDSQSSADDMPPTPTKPNDGAGRRSKESSLRRKTFRQRPSLSNNTFVAPENGGIDIPAASNSQNATTPGASPHTPNESFAPPDPSRLSISGPRRPSLPFHPSSSFPPNTPTTPRDQPPSSIFGQVAIPFEITQNDVDESLCKRFSDVKKLGREQQGHFSQVFRVGGPVRRSSSHASPPGSQFWVVKKSQKPISGPMDYEKRLREVKALQDLRGNEHVVSFEDFWVESNHLYIQTEYCEGGDLKTFLLAAGDKSRLDDFRIWKILLELSSVGFSSSNACQLANM